MDQYEEYFEDNSDNEVEIEHEEFVVGVVAPQPVNIPLDVVFPSVADNPESPAPSLPSLSPELEAPLKFMGFSLPTIVLNWNSGRWMPRVSGLFQTYVWRNRRYQGTLERPKIFMGAPMGAQCHSTGRGGPHLQAEGLPSWQ